MKRQFMKKKAYQAFCREQVKRGLINQPDGSWRSNPGDTTGPGSRRMAEMMKAGYRL